MQAGCRLTFFIINNFLKVQVGVQPGVQAGCRLGAGWVQADFYQYKELFKSAGWSVSWIMQKRVQAGCRLGAG